MSLNRASRQAADAGDRRAIRTRSAVIGAFNRLVLERGYDRIGAQDIADEANVGRSTFYKHFSGKRDVLRDSLPPRLKPLADLPFSDDPHPAVTATLEHFWENRRVGRFILSGDAADVMTLVLADMIAERLETLDSAAARLIMAERDYTALYLSNGIMGALRTWLEARRHCDAAQLARTLHGLSRSALLSTGIGRTD